MGLMPQSHSLRRSRKFCCDSTQLPRDFPHTSTALSPVSLRHLRGCFHLVATVNSAATNMTYRLLATDFKSFTWDGCCWLIRKCSSIHCWETTRQLYTGLYRFNFPPGLHCYYLVSMVVWMAPCSFCLHFCNHSHILPDLARTRKQHLISNVLTLESLIFRNNIISVSYELVENLSLTKYTQ